MLHYQCWKHHQQHNSKVLSKTNDKNNCICNFRSKPYCPLNRECLTQCLVYKATSTTSSNSFVYYGTSKGELNTQYNNHTKSFRHRECVNETELSKRVWNLKDHGLDNNLSWEIDNFLYQFFKIHLLPEDCFNNMKLLVSVMWI